MKKFEDYITDKNIISSLIRFRVRIARARGKQNIIKGLSSEPKNKFTSIDPTEEELRPLLPPRRLWKKLSENSRKSKSGQQLSSLDRNQLSLKWTIEYYRDRNADLPFVRELNDFIESIKNACKDKYYEFEKPKTYPKLKEVKDGQTICRPITRYKLKDRIVISLTNKYFTDLFDEYFDDCSFAFRAGKHKQGTCIVLNHHDAFESVKKYRESFQGEGLFVAECDIQKFFDSINHAEIKRVFRRLQNKVRRDKHSFYSADAERLFYCYLKSFAFNKDVFTLNGNQSYFKEHGIDNGVFKWVEKELISERHYWTCKRAKIGVPQGGALSGLIVNMVLDSVDRRVLKGKDPELFYVRYCDDMLIIHPRIEVCQRVFEEYQKGLRKAKLVPHQPSNVRKASDFWEAKTKPPYLWSCGTNESEHRWIGFVGYELHFNKYVRVRKKSLKKEMEKQVEVTKKVLRAIYRGRASVAKRTIEESVVNTLIGMSVGRVKIWNYQKFKNEICWADGFKLMRLYQNKYSRVQLKRLDQARNKVIKQFRKSLKRIPSDALGQEKKKEEEK